MSSILEFNSKAWDKQVRSGNRWTVPVGPDVIARARKADWSILLTSTRPVPRDWFPELRGCDVLCLASGGGQQGPILAAAGANVTVLDASRDQLAQDRFVAERDGLELTTVQGDMADLSAFDDAWFDLIVHPVSNVFAPDIAPVWREAFRVLRPGGILLAGFDNPVLHVWDLDAYDRGQLKIKYRLPHSEAEVLSADEIRKREAAGEPLEFGHTLESQIGGQLEAGFLITGFYEDTFEPEAGDLLSEYMPVFCATRAVKPSSHNV